MQLGKDKSRMWVSMMTSRRGKTFRITGSLRGDSSHEVKCFMHFKVFKKVAKNVFNGVNLTLFRVCYQNQTTLSKPIDDPLFHDDIMIRHEVPLQRSSNAKLLCFSLGCCTNSRFACDLRRFNAHMRSLQWKYTLGRSLRWMRWMRSTNQNIQ